MSRREYQYRLTCNIKGCRETVYYTFSSRKEMIYFMKRNPPDKYMCIKHEHPEKDLSIQKKIETIFICKKSNKINDLFWFEKGNTNNIGYGFLHGDGFNVWADDFKEGTVLKITAEIIGKE